MRILYLDGERLRRSLVAGFEFVQQRRAELNRINVFPVPDGDTGTNLALTASAVAQRLKRVQAPEVGVVAREAADAAILGARGNCGMILSHFMLGFADSVAARTRLDVPEFGRSMREAARHVYGALERPVEGTIISVMRAVADEAAGAGTRDFAVLIERLLERARTALAATPDQLPELRRAGVVDAGAKGFVHIVEGIAALVRGDPFTAAEVSEEDEPVVAAAQVDYPTGEESYRFCTEALVRGIDLPATSEVRAALRDAGDSLIVLGDGGVLKVHVHTDDPERVFAYLRTLGTLVAHKAEDMHAQHEAVGRAAARHGLSRRPVSFVTDSACNLPDEVIHAHGIHVVPMTIVVEDGMLRDGLDITPGEFVARLEAGERPTTSQPPPAAFLKALRTAAEEGESVLAVLVSGALSGTFASAEAAAKQLPGADVRLVDSRAAALTQGLLLLRAAELAERGEPIDAILADLEQTRARSGLLFTVEVFDNLLASGRVGRGRVLIADLLDIKPILGLDDGGRVHPVARVRGSRRVPERMLEIVAERVPAGARLRFGVMHVGRPAIVDALLPELRRRYDDPEVLVAPVTPVLATHLGPGAWGIAWQVEG